MEPGVPAGSLTPTLFLFRNTHACTYGIYAKGPIFY